MKTLDELLLSKQVFVMLTQVVWGLLPLQTVEENPNTYTAQKCVSGQLAASHQVNTICLTQG